MIRVWLGIFASWPLRVALLAWAWNGLNPDRPTRLVTTPTTHPPTHSPTNSPTNPPTNAKSSTLATSSILRAQTGSARADARRSSKRVGCGREIEFNLNPVHFVFVWGGTNYGVTVALPVTLGFAHFGKFKKFDELWNIFCFVKSHNCLLKTFQNPTICNYLFQIYFKFPKIKKRGGGGHRRWRWGRCGSRRFQLCRRFLKIHFSNHFKWIRW